MDNKIEEWGGSELGTKEYWDEAYDSEIKNYKSHGDIGEIWFNEDSQFRVIRWMTKNNIEPNSRIIDLGCGNGMMLIELAREGYVNLVGVDYSAKAVDLASSIAKDQDISIEYKTVDLLQEKDSLFNDLGSFDIVHDKGTYDAISLHPDDPKLKRETYIQNVHHITRDDGMLIITSCNWTEIELEESFKEKFKKIAVIPAPTFKFGGAVGSVVSSVVFKKL